MGYAWFNRVLLQKRSAKKHGTLVGEHHVTSDLARVVVVLGSSDVLEFEPEDLLLIGCENSDRSVHVSHSGSTTVKPEIMSLPC